MPLIHPKIIKRAMSAFLPCPNEHTEILLRWAKNVEAGVHDGETNSDSEFIQQIFVQVLGYSTQGSGERWNLVKNKAVGKGNADIVLGDFSQNGGKIVAPCELKGARTRDLDAVMPSRNKTPVQQAWEYGIDVKGAKWVLVSNYREIRLYAMGYGRQEFEVFNLTRLQDPDEYARFMLVLSAKQLLGGGTERLLADSEEVKLDITKGFYKKYSILREKLIDGLAGKNDACPRSTVVSCAQMILDRIIFIVFAENRSLLPKDTLGKIRNAEKGYSPRPLWTEFIGLFCAINEGSVRLEITGYNGGLFAPIPEMDTFQVGDELCRELIALGEYDFESDVSVNILGHIFEQSISDLEALRSESGVPEKQEASRRKKDGVYYTPPIVTQLMVDRTVGEWLRERRKELGFEALPELTDADLQSIAHTKKGIRRNAKITKHFTAWEKYKETLAEVKILDPACGSGAFLNAVFDYLHTEGTAVNRELTRLSGGQSSLLRWDTHILSKNLFGVDVNRESVEITKLSLWLKTANKNEKLTSLDGNIKVGNSLIDDPAVAGELSFNWKNQFPGVNGGKFDIVLGNPPYIDSELMTAHHGSERKYLAEKYKTTRGNWDIYIAFMEKGMKLLRDSASFLSFITPDKWLSKDFGDSFRIRYSKRIAEIIALPRDIFEDVLVDPVICTFRRKRAEKSKFLIHDGSSIECINEANIGEQLSEPYKLDQLFSRNPEIIAAIESRKISEFHKIALCENACATSDTYVLKKIIEGQKSGLTEEQAEKYYKIVNTGTLDKYVVKWGIKPMTYIHGKYLFPTVLKTEFNNRLGDKYKARASSPKVIIKGLTLLDCAVDTTGAYVPGKETLVIRSNDTELLFAATGFLNSRLVMFYIENKYSSATYNQGISFTCQMINDLPIPKGFNIEELAKLAKENFDCRSEINEITSKLCLFLNASFSFQNGVIKGMDRWFSKTLSAFLSSIEKQIADGKISAAKKAEIAEYCAPIRAKALELHEKAESLDNAIDSYVYGLYKLTPGCISRISE